jgi:Domain of unknown function (DUF6456)
MQTYPTPQNNQQPTPDAPQNKRRRRRKPRPMPAFNPAESPVTRLFYQKDRTGKSLIDTTQLTAADMLRRDFEYAQLQPRTTLNYDPNATRNTPFARQSDNHIAALSDTAIAARHRFHKALDMLGPELSNFAYHVCCLAAGLETAERRLNYPARSGKAILGIALNKLARHYGIDRSDATAGAGFR